MLTELIPSKLSAWWLVAAVVNWVVHGETTQFVVTAANHSALISYETRPSWDEVRWGKVRWVIRALHLI